MSLGWCWSDICSFGLYPKSTTPATNTPKITLKYSTAGTGDAWLDYIQISTQTIMPGNAQWVVSHASFADHPYSKVKISGDFSNGLAWMVNDLGNTTAYAINNGGCLFLQVKRTWVAFIYFVICPEPWCHCKTLQPGFAWYWAQIVGLYTIKILKKQPKIYHNHRKVHNGYKVAMAETEQIYQSLAVEGQIPAPSAILPRWFMTDILHSGICCW